MAGPGKKPGARALPTAWKFRLSWYTSHLQHLDCAGHGAAGVRPPLMIYEENLWLRSL